MVFKGQNSLVCGGISIPKNYIFVLNVIIIFFNLPAAHARSNVATQWVHRYSKIALELFVKAKVQEFFPTISYSLRLKKHTPTPCRPQIFLSLARPPLPIFGRQECHITALPLLHSILQNPGKTVLPLVVALTWFQHSKA